MPKSLYHVVAYRDWPIRYWLPVVLVLATFALDRLFAYNHTNDQLLWHSLAEWADTLAGLLLLLFLFYYLAIVHRLNRLHSAVQAFGRGNRDARIHFVGGDEVAAIGKAFNQMAEQLAAERQEREQVETELRESTALYQGLLAHVDTLIWSVDLHSGEYEYLSAVIEQIYGYPLESFMSNPNFWLEVIHPDDRKRVEDALPSYTSVDVMHEIEYRIIHGKGEIRWIRDHSYFIVDEQGQPRRLNGITSDITDTKQFQEAVSERARLATVRADIGLVLGQSKVLSTILQECTVTIVEQLDVALARVWIYHEAQQVLELQASAGLNESLDGRYEKIALGQSVIGWIAEEQQPYLTNAIANDPKITEYAWIQQNGIVAFTGYPLKVEGRMVGVMAIFMRQTISQSTFDDLAAVAFAIAQLIERKRTENALSISEERLRLALEGAQDGVWDWDGKSGKTTFNHRWAAMLGYTEREIRLSREEWEAVIHPDDRARAFSAMEAHATGQSPFFEEELRFRTQSGDWRWTLNRGQVVARDPEGKPQRIAGTCKDIAERKQAEEMLQSFFRISPDILAVANVTQNVQLMQINPAFEQLLGYSTQELLAGNPLDLIHPDDRAGAADAIGRLIAAQKVVSFENRFRRKDGSYCWLSWHAILGQDDRQVFAIGRDITATKRLSMMMEQSQAAAHVGGWELDYLTGKLYWTDEMYRIYEVSPDDYTPTMESALAFFAPDSIPLARSSIEQSRMTGEPWDVELEIITGKGQRIWVHDVGKFEVENGRIVKSYGAIQNITERKQTELALRQSEARNRAILDAIPDLVLITDRDGVYLDIPKLGNSPHSMDGTMMIGKRVDEILPAPYGQQAHEAIRLAAAGKKQILEHPIQLFDNPPVYVEARIVPFESDRVVIIVRDITERKQMDEERYMRKIAESVPHLMFVYDLVNERHIYINSQVQRDLGYTPEQFLALGPTFVERVLHEEDYQRFPELRERWTGAKDRQVFETEYRMRHIDGNWRWFLGRDTVFSRAPDGEVQQIIGTAQDITEMKQTQQQLMAALTEKDALLKEVHHRVKNNLQIISSLLNLQVTQIKEPMMLDIFNETKRRVRSMALLHETLYRTENLAQIDFHYYVDTLCHYLLRSFGIDNFRIHLNTEIAEVQLDMERAIPCGLIINELVSNALKYAFPDERHGHIWVSMAKDAYGCFQLCVRDDGIGLPTELDLQQSDSLGLRLVNDLTTQLRGTLTIQSDGGTTFTVRF